MIYMKPKLISYVTIISQSYSFFFTCIDAPKNTCRDDSSARVITATMIKKKKKKKKNNTC